MKLRLKGNSIRLRLSQGDVDRLVNSGSVAEVVEFGPAGPVFTYAVETLRDLDAVAAEYDGGRVSVLVPDRTAREWAASDEVGIEAGQGELRIMIEKDFACLKTRPGEDETDMFPNPNVAASC